MNLPFPTKTFFRAMAALTLLISLSGQLWAQRQQIRGIVTEASTGQPLIGVSVLVKGSVYGVTTETDGTFVINAAPNDVLVFNYMGFMPEETAIGNRSHLEIQMHEDVTGIDEVVVIGYGTTTKKELTGSVASLRQDDFDRGTYTNVAGMLQGKVAGLTITNPNGGDPEAKFEMLLRGTNTLLAGTGPLVIIDGVVDADMRNINFQEVESVDVLKDGSAAAIYGTRGSNGVVIITTKRARAGTTQVEYDGQVSVQTVARRAMPMTAKEFEWAVNNYAPHAINSLYGSDTDWFDEITRTPVSHKHSFAISGGAETFSHRTVLNLEQNQGLQRDNNSGKYLFKTNIHQKALQGWLDLGYNAYITKRKSSPANNDAFRQAFIRNPTEPVYDPDNREAGGYFTISEMDYTNPVAMIKERGRERETDDFGVNVRATLNILPVRGLKWDNFVSYGQERYESRTYSTHYYPSLIGTNGQASISNEYSNELQWESTVNYTMHWGAHSLQAIGGYTFQEGFYQHSSMGNQDYDMDYWKTHNIGAGNGLQNKQASMSSGKSSHRYIAFFGRVMYNYDEKYLFSASLRRDGSSRFGANNKWGWFPAVSGGWRISREEFMRGTEWVDELKLRVGYGVTGNQDFANYKSLLLMGNEGFSYYNGQWVNCYVPSQNPNPDFRWERKAEWNAGLDFSFFNGRLSGAVDYYKRTTTDLIYNYSVPLGTYLYDSITANVGTMSNSGIEVVLSGMPVKTKNVSWSSTLTFSHNKNKLESLTNKEFQGVDMKVGWLATPMGAYCQRLVVGESIGSFYAPIWEGVDENGNDILKGSIAGSVSESKWEYIGSAYPDFVLGWSNSLNYKNWDLGITLRASIGGKIFNRYRGDYENIRSLGLKNVLASWLDDTSFTAAPVYSSKYIENATYLKIDNVSLGYNLNFDSDFVQRMRLYFSAQNLLCLTGYSGVDPEVSLSGLAPGIESTSYYPRTTVFTLGVNITF